MTLSTSFSSLVKSNNGFFKSEKQAAFLLNQCNGGCYVAADSVFGNTYQIWYTCDSTGVVKVEKFTNAKGAVLQWERVEEGKVSIQTTKEFKRLTRMRNGYVKSISERKASMDAGTYSAPVVVYNEAMQRDADSIVRIDEMLSNLV